MKKICSFLCLSLFASLIHAAVMPMDLNTNIHNHQVVHTSEKKHDLHPILDVHEMHADHQVTHCASDNAQLCDEISQHSSSSETKEVCFGNGHQCCLGIILTPTFKHDLISSFEISLVSKNSSLSLQTLTNFIFKPPKA